MHRIRMPDLNMTQLFVGANGAIGWLLDDKGMTLKWNRLVEKEFVHIATYKVGSH